MKPQQGEPQQNKPDYISHDSQTIIGSGSPTGYASSSNSAAKESSLSLTWEQVEGIWGKSLGSNINLGGTIKQERSRVGTQSRIKVKIHSMSEPGTSLTSVPDYELSEVLGEGGMGVVYTARQTSIDREIALKMIKGEAATNIDQKNKFLSEAAVTGDLAHPNIVPIYDLGSNEDGQLFYAMKKVEGTPWDVVIRDKPQNENIEILMRVSDAVAFAHSKGVIHRDLKPENVMLGAFGEVLVMDWGLAGSITMGGKAEPLTESSTYGGTPAYMAPEMVSCEAGSLGVHSDVYLLGAILYEIVTGLCPHTGKNITESMVNIAQNKIQPSEEKGELVDIALTAMATLPEDRYATVGDFQAAIRSYQQHAESIGLSSRASEDLVRAESSNSYDDFAQALFGYREALELWPENTVAKEGVITVSLAYAECAFDKDDFDLAGSLLDGKVKLHRKLLGEVKKAISARNAHQKRLKRLTVLSIAAGVVIVAGTIVAMLWIRSEQQETKKALVQVQAEKSVAENARQAEVQQRKFAELAEQKAKQENYLNAIALADVKIKEGLYGMARSLLSSCPNRYRNWEWGRLMHLCYLERLTLKGHSQSVSSVAFSSNGKRIVTGSSDKTAKLWDTESGKELLTFKGHSESVTSVAFSSGGKHIVTGSRDKTVKVWDTESGRELLTLKGHSEPVTSVAFSPDGKRIVTGSYDKTAKVWDTESGRELLTLKGHSQSVSSVAFSPDGTRIVTGSGDKAAKVWDTDYGKELLTLKGHSSGVSSVAFSPGGKRIVTGSSDNMAKVWDITGSGKELFTLKGHSSGVSSVAFSPSGKRIATGSSDNTAKVWDAESGKELLTLKGHSGWVNSVAFSPGGKRIVTGSWDKTAMVRDTTSGEELLTLKGHSKPVNSVAFSPDGKRIVSGSWDKTAKLWDTESGKEILTLTGHSGRVYSIVFSPDGKRVISGSWDKTVKLWDTGSGKELLTLKGHSSGVCSVAFSPGGQRIATGSWDNTAKLWDTESGKELLTLKGHSGWVNSVVFSPDGKRIVTASWDNTAKIWDTESGKELLTLKGHSEPVYSVAFSPGGKRIVTASSDKTVKIWDTESGRELLTLKGHSEPVSSAAFSPDGKRIVSGSWDKTTKVWDTESGRECLTLKGHSGGIYSVAFSPDGKRIVTGSSDKTAKIMNTEDWIVNTETKNGTRKSLKH